MNAAMRTAHCITEDALTPDGARERIGEKAFDVLLAEICGPRLTPAETVHALRLMVRLVDQFCAGRKQDLLSLATALARRESAHGDVRAVATQIIVASGGRPLARIADAQRMRRRVPAKSAVELASTHESIEDGET
jgi:hypothetical protein